MVVAVAPNPKAFIACSVRSGVMPRTLSIVVRRILILQRAGDRREVVGEVDKSIVGIADERIKAQGELLAIYCSVADRYALDPRCDVGHRRRHSGAPWRAG